MEEIIVEGLGNRLIALSAAREHLMYMEGRVDKAESSYRFAIATVQNAMDNDPAVLEARERLATIRQIEGDAMACVSKAAISAWESGLTDGRKEWKHEGYEIRLRTTRTPVVTKIKEFVAHLVKADATALINKITLHKKDTLNVSDTIELAGLEIEEKTTCSVKCA